MAVAYRRRRHSRPRALLGGFARSEGPSPPSARSRQGVWPCGLCALPRSRPAGPLAVALDVLSPRTPACARKAWLAGPDHLFLFVLGGGVGLSRSRLQPTCLSLEASHRQPSRLFSALRGRRFDHPCLPCRPPGAPALTTRAARERAASAAPALSRWCRRPMMWLESRLWELPVQAWPAPGRCRAGAGLQWRVASARPARNPARRWCAAGSAPWSKLSNRLLPAPSCRKDDTFARRWLLPAPRGGKDDTTRRSFCAGRQADLAAALRTEVLGGAVPQAVAADWTGADGCPHRGRRDLVTAHVGLPTVGGPPSAAWAADRLPCRVGRDGHPANKIRRFSPRGLRCAPRSRHRRPL